MPPIDGNPVDIITIGIAFCYAVFRMFRHEHSRTMEGFISDISYGLTLFPMILLTGVAFTSKALETLQQGNKVLMSMAGLIALVVTVRRSFERPKQKGNGFHHSVL